MASRPTRRWEVQAMSFGEAVRSVLGRWSNFGGRSSRTEYWFWWLALLGLYLATVVLVAAAGRAGNTLLAVVALAYLVLLVPSLAVFVRRLHDVGRSGWWWLVGLIPFGGFVLLIFTCLDSTPGPNAFGPPPRGSRYEHSSTWHSYLAGPPPGWGSPGSQQPGWGSPPPPPGPPSSWGAAPTPPAPRPGMPPSPQTGPVPSWQQTQAPTAWQQPPNQPATPVAPVGSDPWRAPTVACRTCGQVLAADAAFCSRCGHATAG